MQKYQSDHNPFLGVQAARWYHHQGMNLIPVQEKRPKLKSWEQWQHERQTWDAIANFPWHLGMAAINGINEWRSIDVDEALSFAIIEEILVHLALPKDYPWVAKSGSGIGYHIWFKSTGIPFPVFLPPSTDKQKSVHVGQPLLPTDLETLLPFKQIELRWEECYTVLPPTIHPSGKPYIWRNGTPEGEPTWVLLLEIEQMMRAMTDIGQKEQEEHKRAEQRKTAPPIEIRPRSVSYEEREEEQECIRKWADKALEDELTLLHSKREGQRNPQLNKSAYFLGKFIPHGYLTEQRIRSELSQVAYVIGLGKAEVERTLTSGIKAGKRRPRIYQPLQTRIKQTRQTRKSIVKEERPALQIEQPEAHPGNAKITSITEQADASHKRKKPISDQQLVEYSPDDSGNADAFYDLYGNEFLYCPAYGWMHYTGTHWKRIEDEINENVKDVLRKRHIAAAKLANEFVYKCTIADMRRINGCREAFKSRVIAYTDEFDSDPDMLNCRNGVVNLRTGQVFPHQQSQRYTYCIPTNYHPDADASEWIDYLSTVIEGGEEMLSYLQQAVGYSITGDPKEECLFYLHGPSRSGKGTFTETLLHLFTVPLANEVDFNVFTAKRDGDTNNFDLAPLKPARIIFASESNQSQSLNPAKIKLLTGGNRVYCAFKHKDMFSYKPAFTTWLISNHTVNGDPNDDALWGRVKVITFPNSFLGKEDRGLKTRMRRKDVLEGVLAWAIEGARQWYTLGDTGLTTPEQVKATTEEHRAELDEVKKWIEDCGELDPLAWTANSTVFASYTAWCEANLITHKKSQRLLSLALQNKGCKTGVQKSFGQFQKPKGVQGLKIHE